MEKKAKAAKKQTPWSKKYLAVRAAIYKANSYQLQCLLDGNWQDPAVAGFSFEVMLALAGCDPDIPFDLVE